MKQRLAVVVLTLALSSAIGCSTSSPTGADTMGGERFQGRIASVSQRAGATAFITFQFDRYADRQEIAELATALKNGGQEAMVKLIGEKEPAGWMRVGSGIRSYLHVIRELRRPDGSRVIVALSQRPIQFGEFSRGTRSQNYPLGMVDLVLDAQGRGTGRLIPAAQVRFADGTAELVGYLREPYALLDVKQLH